MADLRELYQGILLHHNKHPRHYGVLAGATHRALGFNPLCGDRVEVFARVEGERIEALQFKSASCAICQASASLMTEALIGKTVSQAGERVAWLQALLSSAEDVGADVAEDGELAALAGVRQFPSRIKCALLPWQTLVDAGVLPAPSKGSDL